MSCIQEPNEAQHGHYNDGYSPYPETNPYDQQNYAENHASTPHDNPGLGYAPRGQEYQTSYPPVRHEHDDSYPLHSLSQAQPPATGTSFRSQPHQQQHHDVTYAGMPGQSYDAGDPNVSPLPSSNNQTFTALSLPYERPDNELEDETENIRHRRTRQRMPRRFKALKHVELFYGNLVLDSPVPARLLDLCVHKDDREFTYMRYSAATGDPNEFKDNGFTLRQVHYDPPRRTELFIVMTMYNEDDTLFTRTMHGVMKNIAYLCKRDRSKTWGKEGWKKVVVCIICDGRQNINPRTLSVVTAIGAYQEGIAKHVVDGRPVAAHIYEYTTQISVTPSNEIEGAEKGIVPVQVIFCVKEKTQKRVNSHRWFFNAFGPILQPNICVLLDVGTIPGPSSIYHLWKVFDINSNVGGACGEITALKGKYWEKLLNPLVAAQDFEYKVSHILDKSLESVFGYVTVLPGAFSAYRYIALQNNSRGEGPLQKYFSCEIPIKLGGGMDIFTESMYLGEDRILPWEIVSKRGGAWLLHYVKSASAITAMPDQISELVMKRRRWLNNSFFAAMFTTLKFYNIYRSSHSIWRKLWIHVELLYQTFSLVFSWFAAGNLFLSFIILTNALEDPTIIGGKAIEVTNAILKYFYIGFLLSCFILALQVGVRPRGSNRVYALAFVGYAALTVYMIFAVIFLAIKGVQQVVATKDHGATPRDLLKNALFRDVIFPLSATVGSYIAASIIHFDPWHMVTSFLQYTLLIPSHINILTVDAFANIYDVSWGRKADNRLGTTRKNDIEVEVAVPTVDPDINADYDDAIRLLSTKLSKEENKVDAANTQEDLFHSFWANAFMVWVLSNALLVAIVLTINGNAKTNGAKHTVNGYLIFILYSVALLAFSRFIGSTMYMFIRLFVGE